MKNYKPIFAPNQKSAYSNNAFVLLALAISNVTNMPYEDHIQKAILSPLNMNSTSFEPASDDKAVLPNEENQWVRRLATSKR